VRHDIHGFLGIACILACPLIACAGDQLNIENIASGDNVVVLMDSRTSDNSGWWCNNDEVLRTTGQLALPNVPAASGCNSEIAVFAAENGMALSTPVTTWTDDDGDVHTITMPPIINVPVSVWIAHAPAAVQAPLDMANAIKIYRDNKVGVQFVATYQDVSFNPAAVTTIGRGCDAIGAIRISAWYTPNRLNIYYVKGPLPQDAPGMNCDHFGDGNIRGDANITFIGARANLASLAHEIGHAFGLRTGKEGGHTNALKGFDENNVMWGGGKPTRSHFSLGQVFRMNTQADEWGGTMLIANGLRSGPGRACPPLTTSDLCPPLALDWQRP